jgi:hypothetical protein
MLIGHDHVAYDRAAISSDLLLAFKFSLLSLS